MDVEDFHGFKLIESLSFSEEKFQSLVQYTTPSPPIPYDDKIKKAGDAASNIAKLLTRLNCLTILVEHNYTDRDYKAEFSAFYAKRFCLPSAHCDRLHFFSKKLPSYGSITCLNQIKALTDEKSYLGFCVVRPTEFHRIGRTVIKYPEPTSNQSKTFDVACRASFTTHLLGQEFKVFGAPFIQQDTQVGACAHAAVWMVGRYMHKLGHCGEVSLQQINDFAKSHQTRGRHYPAQDGLVSTQMLDALHGMGLFAIYYNNFDTNKLNKRFSTRAQLIGSLIYYYVESGFPVIIGLKQHVVVAIGHTLDSKKEAANTIERIPSFIIQDDIIGSYLEFPMVGPFKDVIYKPEDIIDLIAVLPNSVHLQGEYAEAFAHVIIDLFAKNSDDSLIQQCKTEAKDSVKFPSKYRLRTYLLKASDLLVELQKEATANRAPAVVVDLLLRLNFPQYVWISEILSPISDSKEKCIGKLILDSTAAAWDKSLIAILMGKIVFLFDRQHLGLIPYVKPLETEWEFVPRGFSP